MFFNVNGSENITLNKVFRKQNGVFVVVTFPRHIGNDDIIAESQFAVISRGAVGNGLIFIDVFAESNKRRLINASALIRADEFL